MEEERKIVTFVEQAMGAPLTAFKEILSYTSIEEGSIKKLYCSMVRRNCCKWMLEVLLLIKLYEK